MELVDQFPGQMTGQVASAVGIVRIGHAHHLDAIEQRERRCNLIGRLMADVGFASTFAPKPPAAPVRKPVIAEPSTTPTGSPVSEESTTIMP